MAIYPDAVVRLLPANDRQARIVPTAIIDHSNAANSYDLYEWWLTNPNGLESTFQIAWDGTVFQYMDTEVRSDANVDANDFAVSIEAANSPALQAFLNRQDWAGVQRQFAIDGYSPAQSRSLITLHSWLHGVHPTIPRKVCVDGVHGVGWHDKFANWTTPGHVCPGARRKILLENTIYPESFHTGPIPAPSPPGPKENKMNAEELALLKAASVSGKPFVFRDRNTGLAFVLHNDASLQRMPEQKTINLMLLTGQWTSGGKPSDKLGTIGADAIKHLPGYTVH